MTDGTLPCGPALRTASTRKHTQVLSLKPFEALVTERARRLVG